MRKQIDINCDLGEGMGNDRAIMPYISTCNIACGGHFGDEHTMARTIKMAKEFHVKVGAHPSFPDKENFGRAIMTIDDDALAEAIFNQIMRFKQACDKKGMTVNHIKLHGALYNLAAKSVNIAELMVEVFIKTGLNCVIYAPYGSALAEKAKAHFTVLHEAFIDRTYHSDLSLVDRKKKGAIISSPKMAWIRLYSMIKHNEVPTIEGSKTMIMADTYCIHSDNDKALEILDYIYNELHQKQIYVKDPEA